MPWSLILNIVAIYNTGYKIWVPFHVANVYLKFSVQKMAIKAQTAWITISVLSEGPVTMLIWQWQKQKEMTSCSKTNSTWTCYPHPRQQLLPGFQICFLQFSMRAQTSLRLPTVSHIACLITKEKSFRKSIYVYISASWMLSQNLIPIQSFTLMSSGTDSAMTHVYSTLDMTNEQMSFSTLFVFFQKSITLPFRKLEEQSLF